MPSSCSNAPQAGTGDEKEKTLIPLSVLCSSAGDGCTVRPQCPRSHPPARHQQVTHHHFELLFGDPAKWGERAEVWFKSQQLPRAFQRCHKRVALGTPTGTALAEAESQASQGCPGATKGPGSCTATPHLPAGSTGAHSTLPARLWAPRGSQPGNICNICCSSSFPFLNRISHQQARAGFVQGNIYAQSSGGDQNKQLGMLTPPGPASQPEPPAPAPNCFTLNILCPSHHLCNPGVTFACLLKHRELSLGFWTHQSPMGPGQLCPVISQHTMAAFESQGCSKLLPDGHLLFPAGKGGGCSSHLSRNPWKPNTAFSAHGP